MGIFLASSLYCSQAVFSPAAANASRWAAGVTIESVQDNMELWTIIASLAALLSAAVAAIYTWLTFRLVRSQNEPNVVVYVKHDESRTTIIQIVIENIGRGIATDITFKSSRSIPAHAWGISIDQAKQAEIMTEGPLINGIPALGPGDSRKLSWGQYGGLMKALGNDPLLLTFQFKDGNRQMPSRSVILECASFAHTDAVDSETVRIIKELKRIADAMEKSAKH